VVISRFLGNPDANHSLMNGCVGQQFCQMVVIGSAKLVFNHHDMIFIADNVGDNVA